MKKIMFNDKYCLTKAVLEGWKTQTRRLASYDVNLLRCMQFSHFDSKGRLILTSSIGTARITPPYKVGEAVAIAQSYNDINREFMKKGGEFYGILCSCKSAGMNNKMFVRPGIMPHRIKMTNLRIERLQDICVEDCLKEGIKLHKGRFLVENDRGVAFYTNSPLLAYRYLINGTWGRGTWENNPYVFVYDFELIQ